MTARKAGFAFATLVALSLTHVGTTQVSKMPGMTPRPVAEGQARSMRHMDPAQMLRLSLVLEPRDPDELQQLVHDVQDRTSPRFHRFLTFDEWKSRYAPSS